MQSPFLDFRILASFSVALAAVIFALGVAYLCRHTLSAAFRDLTARFSQKSRSRALEAIESLKSDLMEFRREMNLLEEYAPEYQISFTSGGWSWLVSTAEHLLAAEHIIDALWTAGRYQDAYTLAAFVNGTLAHAEMPLAALRFADFVDLLDWKARAKGQLLKLIDLLNEGASINQEIGLQRARKRKPTTLALSELKLRLDQ